MRIIRGLEMVQYNNNRGVGTIRGGWKLFDLIKVVGWNNRVEEAGQIENASFLVHGLSKHIRMNLITLRGYICLLAGIIQK